MKSFASGLEFKNIFELNDTNPWFEFYPFNKTPDDLFGINQEDYWNVKYPSLDFSEVKPFDNKWTNLKEVHAIEIMNSSTKVDINKDHVVLIKEDLPEIEETFAKPQFAKTKSIIDEDLSIYPNANSNDESKSEVSSDYEENYHEDKTQKPNSKKKTRKYGTLLKIRETWPKRRREDGVKHTRWNRELDRKAFVYLKELLTEQNMDVQEFLHDDNATQMFYKIKTFIKWNLI